MMPAQHFEPGDFTFRNRFGRVASQEVRKVARNEKRNRKNPSSITLNKAGISAMPLQLQRQTPSQIVPKEWIGIIFTNDVIHIYNKTQYLNDSKYIIQQIFQTTNLFVYLQTIPKYLIQYKQHQILCKHTQTDLIFDQNLLLIILRLQHNLKKITKKSQLMSQF
ncbi:Hypothetical_protein [Hexamita inflata]|uniref:Hypothetical_protein n=1 Tax=Hexamita inflata TaxID=28002 RepID=A0AA86NU64_9EUKA|nr:Hypothetical protein HINF_LOCUS13193 [Hexamita inflata]CAI9966692.1 Hypothetical protein HINF_LOCUS54337 [Hexamita inflata]